MFIFIWKVSFVFTKAENKLANRASLLLSPQQWKTRQASKFSNGLLVSLILCQAFEWNIWPLKIVSICLTHHYTQPFVLWEGPSNNTHFHHFCLRERRPPSLISQSTKQTIKCHHHLIPQEPHRPAYFLPTTGSSTTIKMFTRGCLCSPNYFLENLFSFSKFSYTKKRS